MAAAAVTVERLARAFGKLWALHDVSFEVPAGSAFGLLGPNGAGKTTLFSVAAGFLKATAGTVHVLGVDVAEISQLRGRLSMLPQDAAFQGSIPVLDQLVMFARLNGAGEDEGKAQARQALEMVGLGEVAESSARALSHGMNKRVALCQAFMGDPEVIFLDEPTSGLDPENARWVRDLVKSLKQRKTVVISSHNLHEVQQLCDHAAILHQGRLVLAGSMADLTGSSMLLRLVLGGPLPAAARSALEALPSISLVEATEALTFNLHFTPDAAQDRDGALRDLYRTLVQQEVYPRSILEGASLEARFLEITGGQYDGGSAT